jgi:Phospholipase_D-nuclease N-terminal
MVDILLRLAKADPRTIVPLITAVLGAVALFLLIACIGSIVAQPWSPRLKFFWLLVVILVPIVGIAIYALTCIIFSLRTDTRLIS